MLKAHRPTQGTLLAFVASISENNEALSPANQLLFFLRSLRPSRQNDVVLSIRYLEW